MSKQELANCNLSALVTFLGSFLATYSILLLLFGQGVSVQTPDHEVAGSIPGIPQFKMWIRPGTGSTQHREKNWEAI